MLVAIRESVRFDRQAAPRTDVLSRWRARARTYVASRWVLRALVVVLGTILGAAGTMFAMPTAATAEARLVVGDQSLSAQQVAYYGTATVALAETYSRYVTEGWVETYAGQGVTGVQATVIPNTPVVRLSAEADTIEAAVAGADRAADSLVAQVADNSPANRAVELEAEFKASTTAAQEARREVERATSAAAGGRSGGEERLLAARTEQQLADAKVEALRTAYQNTLTASKTPTTGLTKIQPAAPVESQLAQPALLGAVAGGTIAVLGLLVWSMLRPSAAPRSTRHVND